MKDLFRKHFQSLVYYGSKFVADIQVVEDIVVDVFVYYNMKYCNDERLLYLFVKRKCLNHIRYCGRHPIVEIDESLLDQPIENEIIETEVLKNIHLCIDKLPPESKAVIHKFYFEGKKHDQIAKEIARPESTVRSVKRYGLKVLRNLLSKNYKPII